MEGGGATALAACLSGQLPELAGKRVVIIFCGGNIDPNVLSRVIERGLVADGRLCRFTAVISDRPGGLADLATQMASAAQALSRSCTIALLPALMFPLFMFSARSRPATISICAELRDYLKSNGVETFGS